MVFIHIDYFPDGEVDFDATGDVDTVEGAEAIGAYVTLLLAEQTPRRGSGLTTEDVKSVRSDVTNLLDALVERGYIQRYRVTDISTDEDEITMDIVLDGERIEVPADT